MPLHKCDMPTVRGGEDICVHGHSSRKLKDWHRAVDCGLGTPTNTFLAKISGGWCARPNLNQTLVELSPDIHFRHQL